MIYIQPLYFSILNSCYKMCHPGIYLSSPTTSCHLHSENCSSWSSFAVNFKAFTPTPFAFSPISIPCPPVYIPFPPILIILIELEFGQQEYSLQDPI